MSQRMATRNDLPARRSRRHARGLLAALAMIWAGCDDATEPPRATQLSVSPASVSLSYLGETVAVAASITDQRGRAFEGAVSWSSSAPDVFSVNAEGVVAAIANGTGTLQASHGDLVARAAVTVRQEADTVRVVSGSGQRGLQGGRLRDSVVVRAFDAGGAAAPDVSVTFAPSAGGVASPDSARTDADGRAATLWTLGSAAGAQSLAVRAPNGRSATATAEALRPAEIVDSILVLSGRRRRAAPGHALPVRVKVVDDRGAPVQGVPVAFAPGEGHGAVSAATARSDEDGIAVTDWTLGDGTAPQALAASVAGGPSANMTAVTAVPADVRALSDDPSGATGRPVTFSAVLVDAGGVPVEGLLRFEPAQGHGTVDAGDGPAAFAVVRTDTSGAGAVTWTPRGDVAAHPTQSMSVSSSGVARELELRIASGICHRTPQVRDGLVAAANWEGTSKDCSEITAEDLVAGPWIRFLHLENEGIASLKSWDFAGTDPVLVNLTGNELQALPAGVFSGLPRLGSLGLSGNQLTAAAFAALRDVGSLVWLDLSSNPLGEIPADAFATLPQLTILSLADVGLRSLTAGTFSGLEALEGLFLTGNAELAAVPEDAFRGLSALTNLDLSRTGIDTIEPGAFNGLSAVAVFDVGNTPRLETLRKGAFRGLSGLSVLTLDSTAVSAIEPGAFEGLDALEWLIVDRSRLAEWPAGAFRGMPGLQGLWLRDNPRLTTLREKAFVGMPAGLQTLLVSHGPLSTVEPGALDGLAGLQNLHLQENSLTRWPEGAFRGPAGLVALSLSGNGIRDLPATAFAGQAGLRHLLLSRNAIAAWPKAALAALPSLQALDMSDNALGELPRDAFSGLSDALQHLDLRNNPGAPFVLGMRLDRVGSDALEEGDDARVRAVMSDDVPAPFATRVDWTAAGDVIGLREGTAALAAGEVQSEAWGLSGDNNGAAGGAQVIVTGAATLAPDSLFGLEARVVDTLVIDFAADSSRTNRRPVVADSFPAVTLDAPGLGASTAGVDLAAYFSDPDGDSLVFEVVAAREGIVSAVVAADSLALAAAQPGRTILEVRAFDPGGFLAVQDMRVVVSGAFDIEIAYLGEIADEHKRIFEDAAERWEAVLADGLPDVDFSEQNFPAGQCGSESPPVADTVSELRIFASIGPIDGDLNVLAQAGPCALRSDTYLPILGIMSFDEADIPLLEAEPGGLRGVVLHEMAHVLGFGTIWGDEHANLLREPSLGNPGEDTHFVGELAIAAFDAAGGRSYAGAKVPVENSGIPGSTDGHWRESLLINEIMTPNYNSGSDPLSAITIQAMEDIGYVVNVGEAETYRLPGTAAPLRLAESPVVADLRNDIRKGPIVLVDGNGKVSGVIRR